MAKGRKPAIAGVARPEGFLDDVVRPVIQKAAKSVGAGVIEKKMATTRAVNYFNKTRKASRKLDKALENESYRMASRQAKKADVGLAKTRAVGIRGSSVRKAAKGARRRGGYR